MELRMVFEWSACKNEGCFVLFCIYIIACKYLFVWLVLGWLDWLVSRPIGGHQQCVINSINRYLTISSYEICTRMKRELEIILALFASSKQQKRKRTINALFYNRNNEWLNELNFSLLHYLNSTINKQQNQHTTQQSTNNWVSERSFEYAWNKTKDSLKLISISTPLVVVVVSLWYYSTLLWMV